MDPLSLPAAAVGLLVPFFKPTTDKDAERASAAIANATLPRVKALYQRAKLAWGQRARRAALRCPSWARRWTLGAEGKLAEPWAQDQQFAAALT